MGIKRYSLGIVQTHATQFDGPLLKRLSRHPDIELTVYYTKPSGKAPFDKEIEHDSFVGFGVTTYAYAYASGQVLFAANIIKGPAMRRHVSAR